MLLLTCYKAILSQQTTVIFGVSKSELMYLRCFCCLLCIEILVLSLSVFAVFKYSESCLSEEIGFDRTQKLLICVVSNHGAPVRGGPLKISCLFVGIGVLCASAYRLLRRVVWECLVTEHRDRDLFLLPLSPVSCWLWWSDLHERRLHYWARQSWGADEFKWRLCNYF